MLHAAETGRGRRQRPLRLSRLLLPGGFSWAIEYRILATLLINFDRDIPANPTILNAAQTLPRRP
jgi:hypothetical protein